MTFQRTAAETRREARGRRPTPPAGAAMLRVLIESAVDGGAAGHVAELPGCIAIAEDEAGALERLPEQVERHRNWREAHALPRVPDEVRLSVVEVVHGPRPWMPNGSSALFALDRRLLTDEEYTLHLRVLACARADLLHAAHALPRGAFDETVPGGARTPREILLHLAEMEEWLVSRLGRRMHVAERDPIRRLVDVRARTLEHLARYAREDRDLIFIPTEQRSDDPEEMWTLRKFLRRMIEHEMEHLDELRIAVQHWSHGTGLD